MNSSAEALANRESIDQLITVPADMPDDVPCVAGGLCEGAEKFAENPEL